MSLAVYSLHHYELKVHILRNYTYFSDFDKVVVPLSPYVYHKETVLISEESYNVNIVFSLSSNQR